MATDTQSAAARPPDPPPPPPPPAESRNQERADRDGLRPTPEFRKGLDDFSARKEAGQASGELANPGERPTDKGLEPTQDFQQGLDDFRARKVEGQESGRLVDFSKPEQPDPSRPDAAQPDADRPDPTRPDTGRPDPMRPDADRPDPTRPATDVPEQALRDPSLSETDRSGPDARPVDPAVPDRPDTTSPAASDVPDAADVPDVPETPDEPAIPDEPEPPDQPDPVEDRRDRPGDPDVPHPADAEDVPDVPEEPDLPEQVDGPAVPEPPDGAEHLPTREDAERGADEPQHLEADGPVDESTTPDTQDGSAEASEVPEARSDPIDVDDRGEQQPDDTHPGDGERRDGGVDGQHDTTSLYRVAFYSDQEHQEIADGVDRDIASGDVAADRRDEETGMRLDQLCEDRARTGEWFAAEPFRSADDAITRGAIAPEWHSRVFDTDVRSTSGLHIRQYRVDMPADQLRYVGAAKPQGGLGSGIGADLEGLVTQAWVPPDARSGRWSTTEVGFAAGTDDGRDEGSGAAATEFVQDTRSREHHHGTELPPLQSAEQPAHDIPDHVARAFVGSMWEQGSPPRDDTFRG